MTKKTSAYSSPQKWPYDINRPSCSINQVQPHGHRCLGYSPRETLKKTLKFGEIRTSDEQNG